MNGSMGRFLVAAGIILVITGLVFIYKDSMPLLKHLGKLPGDIQIKKEGFSFYFPVVTCIVLSIVATIVIYIINRIK